MAILNYTTKIPARRTVGEIQEKLTEMGAHSVSIENDASRQPCAVTFRMKVAGELLEFRLPSRWEGVQDALFHDPKVPNQLTSEAHARDVAWRIIKDWVEAQLAIIEAGAVEVAEVFLPYMIQPGSDQTLFEFYRDRWMLPAGESIEGEYQEGKE